MAPPARRTSTASRQHHAGTEQFHRIAQIDRRLRIDDELLEPEVQRGQTLGLFGMHPGIEIGAQCHENRTTSTRRFGDAVEVLCIECFTQCARPGHRTFEQHEAAFGRRGRFNRGLTICPGSMLRHAQVIGSTSTLHAARRSCARDRVRELQIPHRPIIDA